MKTEGYKRWIRKNFTAEGIESAIGEKVKIKQIKLKL